MRKNKPLKNPNGYGSVVYLGERRRRPYGARVTSGFDENGKQKFKYVGYYEKRDEAMLALAEFYKTPLDAGALDVTLEELTKYALEDVQNASTATINLVKYGMEILQPLMKKPVRKLLITDINALNIEDKKKLYVKTFLFHVEKVADIHNVDMRKLSNQIVLDKKQSAIRNIFTENEIENLWTKTDKDFVKITLIYIYSGWRVEELLDMPLNNIDLVNWTMKGGNKTTAGKNRLVPIHERIQPLVKYFMDKAGKNIFNLNDHQIRYKMKRATGHIPHECRHTFQTRLINAGVDTITIDKLMGHSGSVGETVYTHKTIDQLRTAIAKLT